MTKLRLEDKFIMVTIDPKQRDKQVSFIKQLAVQEKANIGVVMKDKNGVYGLRLDLFPSDEALTNVFGALSTENIAYRNGRFDKIRENFNDDPLIQKYKREQADLAAATKAKARIKAHPTGRALAYQSH